MRSISITARLLLIALLLSIPVVVLVYMLSSEQQKAITFAEAERRGVEYHAPVRALMEDLVKHRTAGARYLASNGANRDALLQLQSEVDESLARLAEVDGRLGAEMQTTAQFTSLRKSWDDLRGQVMGWTATDLPLYLSIHNQVNYDLVRLANKMGNHSNLILDPDIDTYYLMDATQFKLPTLLDQVGQLQTHGIIVIELYGVSGDRLSEEETAKVREVVAASRAQIESAVIRSQSVLDEGQVNLQYAYAANPGLRANMSGPGDALKQSVTDVIDLTRLKLTRAPQVDASAWLGQTDRVLSGGLSMFDVSLANLDNGLKVRIEHASGARTVALGSAVAVLAFALGLVMLIARSITVPLARLSHAAEQVSTGNLTAPIDLEGGDEISVLAAQFNRMRESIRLAADHLGSAF